MEHTLLRQRLHGFLTDSERNKTVIIEAGGKNTILVSAVQMGISGRR